MGRRHCDFWVSSEQVILSCWLLWLPFEHRHSECISIGVDEKARDACNAVLTMTLTVTLPPSQVSLVFGLSIEWRE